MSMDFEETGYRNAGRSEENYRDMRKGPWTDEEDSLLISYVNLHGEGHWNSLARSAGLKRTGKSCRLRWLNYLRPDVRRGNITLQEQLLILELHSRWGNRWSKIAEHLPGRTDNEIKNYWRTRVQKQAKQLKCDVDSIQFRDTMRYVWIPRLAERIRSQSESPAVDQPMTTTTNRVCNDTDMGINQGFNINNKGSNYEIGFGQAGPNMNHEMSGCSSNSLETQVSPVSDLTDCNDFPGGNNFGCFQNGFGYCPESAVACTYGFQHDNNAGLGCEDSFENMWNDEDICFLLQQFNYEV